MSRKTRKLIWSAPLVAVFAVVGALVAFGALGLGGVFADDLADAPMNLDVVAADGSAGRTTLVLTWEAPASGAPDMYRIDRSNNNDKWKYLTSVSGTTLTHTDATVGGVFDTGRTRYYRVLAVDMGHGMDMDYGAGAVSTSESATTDPITVPHQVKPFDADGNGPEAIDLTWTVPDDGGSDILGYCIRAWPTGTTVDPIQPITEANCKDAFFQQGPGGSAGDYRAAANANTEDGGIIRILPATSYTHKGRRAMQEWSYEIYALNEHGYSMTGSATREATTDEADDPPKPGNLLIRQVDSPSDEIIELYWTVSGDGGQDIVAYRVEVSDTNGQWPVEDTALPISLDEERTSGGILNDKVSGVAGTPQVVVIGLDPAAPGVVFSYDLRHQVGGLTAGSVPSKLYYRVRAETEAADGTNRKMSAYTNDSTDLTEIVGVASFVHSDMNPSQPMLDADADDGETNLSPSDLLMDSLMDDDVIPGEVTLTVTKSVLGGSDDYRVDISDDAGVTWSMVHSSTRPINQTEYEHQGLKPDVLRAFRIFTKKGSAYGVGSNVVQDRSAHSHAPGEVRDLTAMADGAGKVNLTWMMPEDDGGAMIDKYCIIAEQVNDETPREVIGTDFMRSETGGGTNEIRVVSDGTNDPNCARFSLPNKPTISDAANGIYDVAVSTTSVMFTNLDQETRWQFQVYGLNDATAPGIPSDDPDILKGVAEKSETEDAKTTEAMVPSAPMNLTAELARDTNFTGVGSRGVLVLWNAPADPAGAPVLGYKIERSIDGGEYEERVSSRDAGMTHWVDTSEPAAGEVRTYRLTSINAAGVGTMTAMATIPLDASHSHAAPVFSAPTNVAATSTGGTISISWMPGDAATSQVIIAVNAADDTDYCLHVDTSGTLATHDCENLTVGATYVVLVIALDGQGYMLGNVETHVAQ